MASACKKLAQDALAVQDPCGVRIPSSAETKSRKVSLLGSTGDRQREWSLSSYAAVAHSPSRASSFFLCM